MNWSSNTVYFYTPDGRRVNSYTMQFVGNAMQFYSGGFNYYFAGRLVQSNGQLVVTDRLGSVRANLSTSERFKYFPYGEENSNPATQNEREKFGTYYRDSTGLDYADQRYYSNGRFLTPDPYRASVTSRTDPQTPQSWNRYTYTQNDPVNFNDPTGRMMCGPEDCPELPECDPLFPELCPPDPGPQPQDPPHIKCDIGVAHSGRPRYGQDVTTTVNGPPRNILGPYTTIGQVGTPPAFQGWFFAVQIQGNLFGDVDPNDWNATQGGLASGGITYQLLNGKTVSATLSISTLADGPAPDATNQITTCGIGRFDWIDLPGFSYFGPGGAIVVGADITFDFTSTIFNWNTGATCSRSWELHLTVNGDKWTFTY